MHLYVDIIMDNENKTVAVMDTEHLGYHQWEMSQCPSMVAEYLKCCAHTENDVVHLLTDLDLIGTHKHVDHGRMNTVIRCKTQYFINITSPLILSFPLGNNVALYSVFDIPCFLAMCAIVDLVKGQIVCSEIKQNLCYNSTLQAKSYLMVLTLTILLLRCLTVFLLMFHPCPSPFSILPLMESLILCLRIVILVSGVHLL